MKAYIIMDGRATYDINKAAVIDKINARSLKSAIKYFKKNYSEHDYVLTNETGDVLFTNEGADS